MANKWVLVAVLALAVVAVSGKKSASAVSVLEKVLNGNPMPNIPKGYTSQNPRTVEHTFRTRVDHFNPQNRATFEFQYLSNDEYYQQGGPIFVFVGGNHPITSYFIEQGHFRDIANYENAWLFTNEHRYYGNSTPTADLSVENLRFLTVEQGLVDLAEWIHHLRHEIVGDPNARVILLGAGYAGAIATWMRQRYPHLVEGAWVSSGQIEARFNFKEYAIEIGELIRDHGSNECYSQIWRAFRTAENLVDVGLAPIVEDLFNTCEPIDAETMLDVETFFFHVKTALQAVILDEQDTETTTELCEQLASNNGTTDLHIIADWVLDFYDFLECMPFDFKAAIDAHQYVDPEAPANALYGLRQRTYQLCTEFGWFLTADADDQPFGYRVTMYFFLNVCRAVYGEWLTSQVVVDGVQLTNMHFGGQNPRISNVYFTNGDLDPVRDVSITEYYEAGAGAIVVPGYFANEDLNSISGYNSPEMLDAKHYVHEFIKSWLWEPIVPI
ncbi:putative serine protease K12H4.7 [Armigeres subalbatus]|uniref:putative serine protease K12H4.7 n=1 Tax=Armigeres subalbatus TaxID=124917 RepID=UPI002ED388C2